MSDTLTFHRPSTEAYDQFTIWTEDHQRVAASLPPCAYHLWQWLLGQAAGGIEQEIDLEQIRIEISKGRNKDYCLQSLKNALFKHLIPKGLVQITKEYTRRIFKVVANHVGHVQVFLKKIGESAKKVAETQINLSKPKIISEIGLETLTESQSFSQINQEESDQSNNALGAVAVKEEIQDPNQFTKTPICVESFGQNSVTKQGNGEEKSSAPRRAEIFENFSTQLNELDIESNQTVKDMMEKFGDRVPDALAYVREQLPKGWVKSSTALFVKALQTGRKPKEVQRSPEPIPQPQQMDYWRLDQSLSQAWQGGDRTFVESRLSELCRSGFLPEAERLCNAHPNWGFVIENGCVEVF